MTKQLDVVNKKYDAKLVVAPDENNTQGKVQQESMCSSTREKIANDEYHCVTIPSTTTIHEEDVVTYRELNKAIVARYARSLNNNDNHASSRGDTFPAFRANTDGIVVVASSKSFHGETFTVTVATVAMVVVLLWKMQVWEGPLWIE